MAKVRALILRGPGTNCDVETDFAFQQAGAIASSIHVNQLIRHEQRLSDYQIFVIPGGFTYGDDLGAGRVLANELKLRFGADIENFIDNGGLILGICNGFQVMVKAGILPRAANGSTLSATLADNDSGRFECRWIYMTANRKSPCIFTEGIERLYLPVAHGEGKFVTGGGELPEPNIALYYTNEQGNTGAGYPHNPNGSKRDIAGICDSSGRIFALMPHPERFIRGTQHPRWTREGIKEQGDGFQIFLNAVR
ncbi:phosphoribosylformylglycinamidine synthase subunit PurQ, partial [Chloroflexota bacterium]